MSDLKGQSYQRNSPAMTCAVRWDGVSYVDIWQGQLGGMGLGINLSNTGVGFAAFTRVISHTRTRMRNTDMNTKHGYEHETKGHKHERKHENGHRNEGRTQWNMKHRNEHETQT